MSTLFIPSSLTYGILVVGIFCISLLTQWTLWHTVEFADEPLWQMRTLNLVRDLSLSIPLQQQDYSGHPGTSFLVIAFLLHLIFPIASFELLDASVSLILATTLAATIGVIYRMSPRDIPWWVGAAGLMIFQPLFVRTSPTSAIATPLIVLMFFLLANMYNKRPSRSTLVILGISLGFVLSTRWFTTLLFIAPLITLFVLRFKYRSLWISLFTAIGAAWILNPLLWHNALNHITYSVNRLLLHVTSLTVDEVTVMETLLYLPFSLLAFCVVLYALIQKRHALFSPVSAVFMRDITIVTIGTVCLLLLAQSKSLRYFFPVIFFWDAMLPLLVLNMLNPHSRSLSPHMRSFLLYLSMIFLAGAQAYLFLERI